MRPRIIFEDTHLAVFDKPAGLLSQGEETGDENLVDWCRAYFGRNYVGLVHRLDRNTSGLLVVAKRSKAAERLTESLKGGALKRDYLALLVGRLEAPARWQGWLLKDEYKNKTRVVPKGTRDSKHAALNVRPLQEATWKGLPLTLAEFVLDTGRSHQIRVQAAEHQVPLLGDVKYGRASGPASDFGRPALHSARLRFPHPMSQEPMSFDAPLPDDMARVLGN
jgi:23S rRNA pseudouridine1911/1915/1917 synthase